MAASVLLALSSWLILVMTLARVLFGFVLRTTRVGLRPTTWLVGAMSYSCTTVSRGAADDLIFASNARLAALIAAQNALWQQLVCPSDDERFDFVSGLHEETVAKAAGALGQTFAGAVLPMILWR